MESAEQVPSQEYKMINHSNGARITCTQKYLIHWIARGFEVEEVAVEEEGEAE